MMLCVIGNSHAGMIVAAHRDGVWPGCDLQLFAKPSMEPGEVTIDGTVISAATEAFRARLDDMGMPHSADLTTFDAILMVGMTASIFTVANVLQNHDVYGLKSTRLPEEGPAERGILSAAAFGAILTDAVRDGLTWQIASTAGDHHPPIFVLPQPYPSANVLNIKRKLGVVKRLHRKEDGPAIAEFLTRAHDAAFSELPNVRVMRQPEQTIAHGFLTDTAFTRGSVRLNIDMAHRKDDILHANAAFGALCLEELAQAMSGEFTLNQMENGAAT